MLKLLVAAILLSVTAVAQSGAPATASSAAPGVAPQAAQPSPAQPIDDLAQLRQDLNRLDGLLNNMSAEVEFLHDQNLQILLRTNGQMWTILIRDMRQQLAREEARRSSNGVQDGATAAPKPKK